MGTTAKGHPYPEPTDPLANMDLAIKALAQFLSDNGFKAAHIQEINGLVPAGASTVTVNAVFPVGKFSAVPLVVATGKDTSQFNMGVGAVTAALAPITWRHSQGTLAPAGGTAVKAHVLSVQLA